MTFAISGLLLFGILSVLAIWWGEQPIFGSIVTFLFGFFVAASGAAPIVTDVLTALASLFHGHQH